MSKCGWFRKHEWGPPFAAPPGLDVEGRRRLGINLDLAIRSSHRDAFAAMLCGQKIRICKLCGRAERAPET